MMTLGSTGDFKRNSSNRRPKILKKEKKTA